MKFNSLKTKIILLVFLCIFLLSAASTLFAYISFTRILNENIASKMNLLCEGEGKKTDQMFMRIEDAVNNIAIFLENKFERPEMARDAEYRKTILNEADSLLFAMVKSIDGVVSHYVSFNPELIDGIDGFIYRLDKSGVLVPVELTDIRAYDSSDIEHVGWFYIPVAHKKGTWMEPYQNKNLDCYMISYVVPFFKNGTLLGIAGIDIDFKVMVDSVSKIIFNKSGAAYLKSADGAIHYHEEFINGIAQFHGDEIYDIVENADLLDAANTDEKIIRYKSNRIDFVMSFITLHNGMKLVLYDNYSEVYADRINAVVLIFTLTALLGSVFVIIAVNIAYRIAQPIEDLSASANLLASGNLDVELPPETDDEIGILVRGFKAIMKHLRKYTSSMETLAYQDPMTKVKNVASYKLMTENLERQIASGVAEFAVVMCDLNHLKKINDTHGHNAGDIAIKKACELICRSFPYSTVFRIGGDEFVALLQGVEYETRGLIIENFAKTLKGNEKNTRKGEPRVSLAYGMATFIPNEDKSYQDVFNRADAEMYRCKKKMHAERIK